MVARPGRGKGVPSGWKPVLVQGATATAIAPSGEARTRVLPRSKAKSAVRGQTAFHCVAVQAGRLRTSSCQVPKITISGWKKGRAAA